MASYANSTKSGKAGTTDKPSKEVSSDDTADEPQVTPAVNAKQDGDNCPSMALRPAVDKAERTYGSAIHEAGNEDSSHSLKTTKWEEANRQVGVAN